MNQDKTAILADKIRENIQKVVLTSNETIDLLMTALIANGHILIEDIPGVGKTTLVNSLSRSLSLSFNRIQFTPDVLPSDVTGFSMYNIRTGELEFKQGAIMSQIILADEINRASPKTQSSLLEVMEENSVTVDGKTYPVPKPFMVLATQNPVEFVGTFPLPEAQLDRFMMRITIGYPTKAQEIEILSRFQHGSPLESLESVATSEDVLEMQSDAQKVFVSDAIKNYILSIVTATRNDSSLTLGVSPRASISLMKAAQAYALLQGRNFVKPDDIQTLVRPVLCHRLMLTSQAKIEGMKEEEILGNIINNLEVPVVS